MILGRGKNWNALERLKQDEEANTNLGNHWAVESQGCIVYNDDPEEVVVTLGLEDLVIVRDGKATLILPKNRTQDIKAALKSLQGEEKYRDLL